MVATLIDKCPCKDCITYAICRLQVRSMHNPDVTRFSISKQCVALMTYIEVELEGHEEEINVTRKLFGIGTISEQYDKYEE